MGLAHGKKVRKLKLRSHLLVAEAEQTPKLPGSYPEAHPGAVGVCPAPIQ